MILINGNLVPPKFNMIRKIMVRGRGGISRGWLDLPIATWLRSI